MEGLQLVVSSAWPMLHALIRRGERREKGALALRVFEKLAPGVKIPKSWPIILRPEAVQWESRLKNIVENGLYSQSKLALNSLCQLVFKAVMVQQGFKVSAIPSNYNDYVWLSVNGAVGEEKTSISFIIPDKVIDIIGAVGCFPNDGIFILVRRWKYRPGSAALAVKVSGGRYKVYTWRDQRIPSYY